VVADTPTACARTPYLAIAQDLKSAVLADLLHRRHVVEENALTWAKGTNGGNPDVRLTATVVGQQSELKEWPLVRERTFSEGHGAVVGDAVAVDGKKDVVLLQDALRLRDRLHVIH
jgi:hypothetical protein